MFDFLLGILLAVLLVRGWRRTVAPEAIDLAAVVLGLGISFRISEPLGEAIADRFGGAPETVRLVVGLFVLVVVTVGVLSLARGFAERNRRGRPDLVERLGGAAVAVLTGILLVVFAASMIRALPMGPSADRMVDDSFVTSRLVPRTGVVEEGLTRLVGDEVLASVLALEPVLGERRVVVTGDEVVELEPVEDDSVRQRPELAREVEERINADRVSGDGRPLAWSEGLAGIAAAHASEMYRLGMVARVSPVTGSLDDRIAASSIRLAESAEVMGLAATVSAFHAAVAASPPAAETVRSPVFDRVGVGVAEGPYGAMVVVVLGR